MEVEKIFRMKEGVGANSYAKNSLLQETVITKAWPIVEERIREVYHGLQPQCLMMAEMGCSSGPNALLIVPKIIDIIDKASRGRSQPTPEIGVFLNDLPANDFNTLFSLLPSFYKKVQEKRKGSVEFGSCFVLGIPRSFFGRVFPDQFLHFVHSSYSVHWLSQVPKGLMSKEGEAMNKGNICITKASPPGVKEAYHTQFYEDFTLFLRSRAREMVHGGGMVLTFLGSIKSNDLDSPIELIGSTLHDMVLEDLIEEEKLDNFNMPTYQPTLEEVRELVVEEGSFVLNKLGTFTVDWSVDTSRNIDEQAKFVAKYMRAVTESLLTTVFDEAIMDDLFKRFESRFKERMIAGKRSELFNIMLSVTKA